MQSVSGTYTKIADVVRLGGYLIIDNFPCKVVEISRGGQRNTLRIWFKGIDIFSGERREMIVRGKDIVNVPIVTKTLLVSDNNHKC